MDTELRNLFQATFDRDVVLSEARDRGAVVRLKSIHPSDFVLSLVASASGDEKRTIASARRKFSGLTRFTPEESSYYERLTEPMADLVQSMSRRALASANRRARRALAVQLRGTGIADVQAVDASQVALPAAAADEFPSTHDGCGGVKLTATLSVLHQTVEKVTCTSARTHDRKALRLDRWLHDRLLLLDRGYYDHTLFETIEERRGRFICPMKTGPQPTIKAIHQGLGQAHIGGVVGPELPFRGTVDLDVNLRKRDGSTYACRVIRVQVWKDCRNGYLEQQDIWLVTNLPREKFSPEQIAVLYRLRWEVELGFKVLKTVCRLDHLRSTNSAVIRAFIYSAILAMTLAQSVCEKMRRFWPKLEPSVYRVCAIVIERLGGLVQTTDPERLTEEISSLIEALRKEGTNPNPGRPYMDQRYAGQLESP